MGRREVMIGIEYGILFDGLPGISIASSRLEWDPGELG